MATNKATSIQTRHIHAQRTGGKISPQCSKMLERAYRINSRIFHKSIGIVEVIICDSKRDMKAVSGSYYVPFAFGLVTIDGKIVVRSAKYGKISPAALERIVTHEMSHVFWLRCVARPGVLWSPFWLVEAIAIQTAKNRYVYPLPKLEMELSFFFGHNLSAEKLLFFRYKKSRLPSKRFTRAMYSLWSHFAGYLEPSGCGPLVRLVQPLKTLSPTAFEKAFKRRYGESLESKFESFLKKRSIL